MAGSVNRVILIGRLGDDPERKHTNAGKEFSSFSLATTKKWEQKEYVTWHRVTVWNEANARFVNSYARKGTLLYVEGEISNRKYEKDGVTHYATDIVVPQWGGIIQIMADGTPKGQANEKGASYGEQSGRSSRTKSKPPPREDMGGDPFDDDPFNDPIPF